MSGQTNEPVSDCKHEWSGPWANFGLYGEPDKHYHVCLSGGCTAILIARGRNCDSSIPHEQASR